MITVLIHTPSAFKMLMRVENVRSRPDKLRYVIFGGEALDSMILKEWYEKHDNGRTVLLNMYGPTETVMLNFLETLQCQSDNNCPTSEFIY